MYNDEKELSEEFKKQAEKMFTYINDCFKSGDFIEFIGLTFSKDGQMMGHTLSGGRVPILTLIGALECQKMQLGAQVITQSHIGTEREESYTYGDNVEKPRGH